MLSEVFITTLAILLSLANVFRNVDCVLTDTPSNVIIVSGSPFRLNCKTNLPAPVQWTNGSNTIYRNKLFDAYYSSKFATDDSSLYDLIAATSDVSYCGRYTCIDNNNNVGAQQATATVTIYDSAPQCNSNSTGPLLSSDFVSFTCQVSLSTKCSNNYSPQTLNLTQTSGVNLASGNITSVSWTGTAATVNSSNVNCLVSSSVKSVCPTISLGTKPYNVAINTKQCTVGDTLECSAGGYPPPSYQWQDLSNGQIFQGALLTISNNMTGNNYTFQCTASNTINSVTYTNSTTASCTVKGLGNNTPIPPVCKDFCSWPWIQASVVIATVAVVIAVCIIILVVYFYSSQTCDYGCDGYSTVVLIVISLLLATGIWIGSAISFYQLNGSSSASNGANNDYVFNQNSRWLIGTIVIGLVEMVILDLLALILNIVAIKKDSEKGIYGVVQIILSVSRFLMYSTVLVWTIVVGEKYKENCQVDYSLTSFWTWQIFLITGACAIVVAILLFVLMRFCREKCCNRVCPK